MPSTASGPSLSCPKPSSPIQKAPAQLRNEANKPSAQRLTRHRSIVSARSDTVEFDLREGNTVATARSLLAVFNHRHSTLNPLRTNGFSDCLITVNHPRLALPSGASRQISRAMFRAHERMPTWRTSDDRWTSPGENGQRLPNARHGSGRRWRARYYDSERQATHPALRQEDRCPALAGLRHDRRWDRQPRRSKPVQGDAGRGRRSSGWPARSTSSRRRGRDTRTR